MSHITSIGDDSITTASGITVSVRKVSGESAKMQAQAQEQGKAGYVLTHSYRPAPGTSLHDVLTAIGRTLYTHLKTIHVGAGSPGASGGTQPDNPTTGGQQCSWHAGAHGIGTVDCGPGGPGGKSGK